MEVAHEDRGPPGPHTSPRRSGVVANGESVPGRGGWWARAAARRATQTAAGGVLGRATGQKGRLAAKGAALGLFRGCRGRGPRARRLGARQKPGERGATCAPWGGPGGAFREDIWPRGPDLGRFFRHIGGVPGQKAAIWAAKRGRRGAICPRKAPFSAVLRETDASFGAGCDGLRR